jgi:hypothetical protein
MKRVVPSLVGIAFVLIAHESLAQEDPSFPDPRPQKPIQHPNGFGISLGLFGGYVSQPPGITNFRTPSGFAYTGLDGAVVQPDGGVGLLGADFLLSYQFKTILWIPVLGARFGFPVGYGFAREIASTPTPSTLRIGSKLWGEFLLPGLGLHFETRTWLVSGALQPVVEFYEVSGTLTQGVLTTELRGSGGSFGADGEVKVCLQGGVLLESLTTDAGWFCLFGAPMLFRTNDSRDPIWNGTLIGISAFGTTPKWPF